MSRRQSAGSDRLAEMRARRSAQRGGDDGGGGGGRPATSESTLGRSGYNDDGGYGDTTGRSSRESMRDESRANLRDSRELNTRSRNRTSLTRYAPSR